MRRFLVLLVFITLIMGVSLVQFYVPADASDGVSFGESFSLDIPAPIEHLGIQLKLSYSLYTDKQCNLHLDISLDGTKGYSYDYKLRNGKEVEPDEKVISFVFTPEDIQYLYGDKYIYPILRAFPDYPGVYLDTVTGNGVDAGIVDFLGIASVDLVMDVPSVPVSPKHPDTMCKFAKQLKPENISFGVVVNAWQSFDGFKRTIPFAGTRVRGLQTVLWYVLYGKGNVGATVIAFWELPYGKVVSEFVHRGELVEYIKWETSLLRVPYNWAFSHSIPNPFYDPWGTEFTVDRVMVPPYFPASHPVGGEHGEIYIPLPTVTATRWLAAISAHLVPTDVSFKPWYFTYNPSLRLYTVESVNAFLKKFLMPPSLRGNWMVEFEDDATVVVEPAVGISTEEIVDAARGIDGIDYSHSKSFIYMMDASKLVGKPQYVIGYYLDPLPVLSYGDAEFIEGSPYIQEGYPAFAVGLSGVLNMALRWSQAGFIDGYLASRDPVLAQAEAIGRSIKEVSLACGLNKLLWSRIDPRVLSLMLYLGDRFFAGFSAPMDTGFLPLVGDIALNSRYLAGYFYSVLKVGKKVEDIPGVGMVINTASGVIAYAGTSKVGEVTGVYGLEGYDLVRFLGLDRVVFADGRVVAVTPDGIAHKLWADEHIDLGDLGYTNIQGTSSVVLANIGDGGFVSGTELKVDISGFKASFVRDDAMIQILAPGTDDVIAELTPQSPTANLPVFSQVDIRFVRKGMEQWAPKIRVDLSPEPPILNDLPDIVYGSTITVSGHVRGYANGISVFLHVNSDVYTASVTPDGYFTATIGLVKGANQIGARTCLGHLCSRFSSPQLVVYLDRVPTPVITYSGPEVLLRPGLIRLSVLVSATGSLELVDNDNLLIEKDVLPGTYVFDILPSRGKHVFKARLCGVGGACSDYSKPVKVGRFASIIEMSVSDIHYIRNGEIYSMDAAPFILPPGRTMVPLRFVATGLGFDVRWNGETREITISGVGRNGENIQIILHMPYQPDKAFTVGGMKVYPGSSKVEIIVNGKRETVDLTDYHGQNMGIPVIANGRTYVPVRFVAEIFGAAVEWVAMEKKVIIRW